MHQIYQFSEKYEHFSLNEDTGNREGSRQACCLMDTYGVHKTRGSWPTCMDRSHATQRATVNKRRWDMERMSRGGKSVERQLQPLSYTQIRDWMGKISKAGNWQCDCQTHTGSASSHMQLSTHSVKTPYISMQSHAAFSTRGLECKNKRCEIKWSQQTIIWQINDDGKQPHLNKVSNSLQHGSVMLSDDAKSQRLPLFIIDFTFCLSIKVIK